MAMETHEGEGGGGGGGVLQLDYNKRQILARVTLN